MYLFKGEQKWQKDLIKDLSKKYKLNRWVVRAIAYYPFLFLKRIMLDDYIERPIRLRSLGVWLLRKNKGKKKRLAERVDFILNHSYMWDKMRKYKKKVEERVPFESEDEFIEYIKKFEYLNSHTLIKNYENKIKELL